MSDESQMRRHPKQARSQQRVDHLLNVAAQVFEEAGFAAATTNAIAARAGVSIGSLYQFFPNKEAILDALVERYVDELQRVVFDAGGNLPISKLIDHMIDQLERFHESHTGFRALFLDAKVEHRIHSVLIQLTDSIIRQHFPTLDTELCRQIAVVWLGITSGMMRLGQQSNNLPESAIRSETKVALFSYLRAVLLRAGLPPPED